MMLDLEISYARDGYMLAFGGRNLLDEYPDKEMPSLTSVVVEIIRRLLAYHGRVVITT